MPAEPSRLSVVLDRDVDQDKSLGPSDPRIRCPLCGWSPRKDDHWFCSCGHEWNTFAREECAPPVFTSGPRPSVFRAVAGRRIRIGMRGERGEVAVISSAAGLSY
jgi:hypothetical protein